MLIPIVVVIGKVSYREVFVYLAIIPRLFNNSSEGSQDLYAEVQNTAGDRRKLPGALISHKGPK